LENWKSKNKKAFLDIKRVHLKSFLPILIFDRLFRIKRLLILNNSAYNVYLFPGTEKAQNINI